MRFLFPLFFVAGFYAPTLFAQESDGLADFVVPAPGCEQAITVFQDVSAVGRKNRAARNISKRHAEMAKAGWKFADMEVYIENGDLEGFYLSYTRAVVCESQT